MKFLIPLTTISAAFAAKTEDLVTTNLPDFEMHDFDVYSGFLTVQTDTLYAETGYDSLVIHYQLDTSRSDTPKTDPLAVWHTGGPGGSSMYGLYGELGFFQISNSGQMANKDYSFNNVANMLYLESPAGAYLTPAARSGSGFSYCLIEGVRQDLCNWDDSSQSAAYTATLAEFYKQFPEFNDNELLLIGESYAGQYLPNIANYILTNENTDIALKSRLTAIAVGNGCWGGGENSFMCNGPNEDRDLTALYHGHGLISTKMYDNIQAVCDFANTAVAFDSADPAPLSKECEKELAKMDIAVGPHNVYNIYDNCPSDSLKGKEKLAWHSASGKSSRWLRKYLHNNLHRGADAHRELKEIGGGYDWTCGQFDAIPAYFERSEVREALHLPAESLTSAFNYDLSGPASVTLYPSLLASGLRVLIYNGDADACVPYIGNEIWTTGMESKGVVNETSPWHTWYVDESDPVPTGSATAYNVFNSKSNKGELADVDGQQFQFVTIRLSGHEAPGFAPRASFNLFQRFVNAEVF